MYKVLFNIKFCLKINVAVMPNLRRKSTVVTYNDDAAFKAIENIRKLQNTENKSTSLKPLIMKDNGIPEVVYSDDGRQFFPCYFCCRAFAIKTDQLSHIQQCNFRDIAKTEPPNQANTAVGNLQQLHPLLYQKRKLQKTKLLTNKMQHGTLKVKSNKFQSLGKSGATSINIISSRTVQQDVQRKTNTLSKPIIQNGIPRLNLFTKIAPKIVQNVTVKCGRDLNKTDFTRIKVSDKNMSKVAYKVVAKPKSKSTNSNNNNKVIKTSNTLKPNIAVQNMEIVQKRKAFPKIRLESHSINVCTKVKKLNNVTIQNLSGIDQINIQKPSTSKISSNCQYCGLIFESKASLVRHKQEKHLHPKILLSPDKLQEYDNVFKNSDKKHCTICGKPVTKKYWSKHLSTHAKEKNYICDICKKGFSRKDHRDLHEKTHLHVTS